MVRSKELIPIYRNVIVWLLKRDLLVMLHMRFRLVASPTLKSLLADRRRKRLESRERRQILSGHLCRGRRRQSSTENDKNLGRHRSIMLERGNEEAVEDDSGEEMLFPVLTPSLQPSPVRSREMISRSSFLSTRGETNRYGKVNPALSLLSGEHRHRRYSDMSPASRIRPSLFPLDFEKQQDLEEEIESESESDPEDRENLGEPSIILSPERATPKERRWLGGMSFGKDAAVAKRFEK